MDFQQIYNLAAPYTMTSRGKMHALYNAVQTINQQGIDGSFVECGVYKGGSVMNMMLTQLNFPTLRHIYLYDTFEGMTPYTEHDVNYRGETAQQILRNPRKMCICSQEEVESHLQLTGYPMEFVHCKKGDVANTLQQELPPKIALLRIDTDWYESTKICLEKLFPKLVSGGILILDDYGYWKGSKKAADEYFASCGIQPTFIPMEEGVSGVMYTKV